MDLYLEDKVAIVSGGTKGIGEGIVRCLAREGAIPVIVNRAGSEGPVILAELNADGKKALYLPAELTQIAESKRVVEETMKSYGRIDIIVNNAGFNDNCGLDRSPEDFMQSVHNNLSHYYALVHFAKDELIRNRGCVVNVGSHVSITGQGATSGYVAAKGAIDALTREWAVYFAPFNVRVNTVVPGSVWTNAYKKWAANFPDPEVRKQLAAQKIPLGRRFTTVEEMADMVVFLASGRATHLTGQVIVNDGGYTHLDRACTA
jgi:L-fucose dehydrogenase